MDASSLTFARSVIPDAGAYVVNKNSQKYSAYPVDLANAHRVDIAARFLGAPFQLRGEVVHGDKRGRELGFPTANLVPDEALVCPGHGVYVARAGEACAAVNVGVRPTFGMGLALLVEAYLLDTAADLYGTELRLEFLTRLRGERRFDSADELIAQMNDDIADTRAWWGSHVA